MVKPLLPLLLFLSFGCTPPKPQPKDLVPTNSENIEIWLATLRTLPIDFAFPTQIPGLSPQGSVDVRVEINEHGVPTRASALTPRSPFAQTAEAFVLSCKFQPTKINSNWVADKMVVKVFYDVPSKTIAVRTQNGQPFRRPEFSQ